MYNKSGPKKKKNCVLVLVYDFLLNFLLDYFQHWQPGLLALLFDESVSLVAPDVGPPRRLGAAPPADTEPCPAVDDVVSLSPPSAILSHMMSTSLAKIRFFFVE